jgi:hypothetical protein
VTERWKNSRSDEVNLYFSPRSVGVISSWRMGWTEHVARIGARNLQGILLGKVIDDTS